MGKKEGVSVFVFFFSKAKPAANVIHAYQHHSFCISVWILGHQKTCHIKMAESNDRRVIGLSMMEPQIHIKKYRERERERDFYLTKRDLWERERERGVGRCERRRGIMVIIRGAASSFHTIKHLHREERPFPFACYLFYSLSLFFFFFLVSVFCF